MSLPAGGGTRSNPAAAASQWSATLDFSPMGLLGRLVARSHLLSRKEPHRLHIKGRGRRIARVVDWRCSDQFHFCVFSSFWRWAPFLSAPRSALHRRLYIPTGQRTAPQNLLHDALATAPQRLPKCPPPGSEPVTALFMPNPRMLRGAYPAPEGCTFTLLMPGSLPRLPSGLLPGSQKTTSVSTGFG